MGGIFLITGIILFFLDLTKIETRFILFPILTIEKILYWPIYYGIILLLTLNFLKAGTKLKRTKPIHGARKIFKIIAIISSACLYLLSVIYIIFYEINLYFITFLGENMFSGILFIIGPTTFSFFCILFLSLLLTTVLEAAEKERRKRVNKKPLVLMLIIFLIFFYAFYEFFM